MSVVQFQRHKAGLASIPRMGACGAGAQLPARPLWRRELAATHLEILMSSAISRNATTWMEPQRGEA